MAHKPRHNRRRRSNDNRRYVCWGSVVKDPNNPPKKATVGDLIGTFVRRLPKSPRYPAAALMALKKPALVALAKENGVKVKSRDTKRVIAAAILALGL